MMQPIRVQGVDVPAFMYGTAWKEADTARCVADALAVGFRAIDTANQRKHYHEAGVGAGIRESGIPRAELFLQTKFTYARGQDHRLPYDPQADPATQVEQSVARSLEHLGVDRLDSYVLHGPASAGSLVEVDEVVWGAMERLHDAGKLGLLGISNVELSQLQELCSRARIQPAFVQNRCYASTGWDREIRAWCSARGIIYQGFSLLTANRKIFGHREFAKLVEHYRRTPAQVVFRFAQQLGMLPLTGTSDPAHMREDLLGLDFELAARDLERLEGLLG